MFPLFIFLSHVVKLSEEPSISVAVKFWFRSYFHPVMVLVLFWKIEKWKKEGAEKRSLWIKTFYKLSLPVGVCCVEKEDVVDNVHIKGSSCKLTQTPLIITKISRYQHLVQNTEHCYSKLLPLQPTVLICSERKYHKIPSLNIQVYFCLIRFFSTGFRMKFMLEYICLL